MDCQMRQMQKILINRKKLWKNLNSIRRITIPRQIFSLSRLQIDFNFKYYFSISQRNRPLEEQLETYSVPFK